MIHFLKHLAIFLGVHCMTNTNAQQNIAERLAYPKDAKLVIIHADDLGAAHAENVASIMAMENGIVSSASIMMPCAWVKEVVDYAAMKKGDPDFGLHLTMTSEWKHYKWGPLTHVDASSGLIDEFGYFHNACDAFAETPLSLIRAELEAQIALAYKMGLKPTHFDSHMGCLFYLRPEVFGLYMELGRKYNLPVLVSRDIFSLDPSLKQYLRDTDIIVDKVYSAEPQDFKNGMAKYYTDVLKKLQAGLNIIIVHPAFDNEEMKAICIDHPDWGAAWRQADYDFLTSKKAKKLIAKHNIKVITWREVGKLISG